MSSLGSHPHIELHGTSIEMTSVGHTPEKTLSYPAMTKNQINVSESFRSRNCFTKHFNKFYQKLLKVNMSSSPNWIKSTTYPVLIWISSSHLPRETGPLVEVSACVIVHNPCH
ncbi:hypothetical protein GDO81_027420 [Engystomops pustulosus]|uniref:Uncharacterized protein n=1 Tax=Engystomops pustulosus TaxID=76066 RepID=A0AAV6Z3Z2_ENGPU|nr:hypothetical protein GDO81_027420 [Engystomops pustulosus]